jgi:hypothetical protein
MMVQLTLRGLRERGDKVPERPMWPDPTELEGLMQPALHGFESLVLMPNVDHGWLIPEKGGTVRDRRDPTVLAAAILERRHPGRSEFVYLMQSSQSRLLKIGRSLSPEARLHTLQCADPTIFLIGAWAATDARMVEQLLHKRYRRQRVDGEWFKLTQVQQNELEGILKGHSAA